MGGAVTNRNRPAAAYSSCRHMHLLTGNLQSMCLAPSTLANGQQIACRKCKLCRFNRIKDIAGRNVAQSKVSKASFAVTLTYGPELGEDRMPIPGRKDHLRMTVMTYSDVQKFLKYLRSHLGYACDFFVTGENGSLKGRVHWHMILHFRDKVPEHVLNTRFSDRHKNDDGKLFDFPVCKAWPHGFMQWKKAEYRHVLYACKYILKDEKDPAAQRKPVMSKAPPLGLAYFRKVAEQHVRQGIAPQTLEYRFPEIKMSKTREPVLFYLQGRSAELYLDHFIETWARERPNQPRPNSDLVDLYERYGQVVHDENALLIRREFPKGESRQKLPTGAEIKTMAAQAEAEKAERQWQRKVEETSEWFEQWISEAEDEQERQARRREFVWFEQRRGQELAKQQHAKGLIWQFGKGWFEPKADEQCECGAAHGQPEPHSGGEGPGVDEHWDAQSGVGRAADYGSGKVGKWNRHYGAGTQAGRDAGSAGPGEAG